MADFSGNFSIQYGAGVKGTLATFPFDATDNETPAGFGDVQAGGFEAGDTIDFTIDTGGPTPITATDTYVGVVVIEGYTLFVTESTTSPGQFFLSGDVAPGDQTTVFNAAAQNYSDLAVNSGAFTVCFAAGILIATPRGERPVETLQIGNLVTTADGRSVPVKWIGRQTIAAIFAGDRARPVRVSAGALGDGLPHTDLVLTADHALILDGLAVNAGALVNGTTITYDPAPTRATYYHIETEAHDVILANGAAAETYVDYTARQAFDNYADYVALYGDDAVIEEMPLPRISSARMLPEGLRRRLARIQAA